MFLLKGLLTMQRELVEISPIFKNLHLASLFFAASPSKDLISFETSSSVCFMLN